MIFFLELISKIPSIFTFASLADKIAISVISLIPYKKKLIFLFLKKTRFNSLLSVLNKDRESVRYSKTNLDF